MSDEFKVPPQVASHPAEVIRLRQLNEELQNINADLESQVKTLTSEITRLKKNLPIWDDYDTLKETVIAYMKNIIGELERDEVSRFKNDNLELLIPKNRDDDDDEDSDEDSLDDCLDRSIAGDPR